MNIKCLQINITLGMSFALLSCNITLMDVKKCHQM